MKRSFLITTLILTIFIVTLIPTSVRAYDGSFVVPDVWVLPEIKVDVAKTIGAIARFDALLTAYDNSGDSYVEEQVFLASEGISSSLEALNAELAIVYPDLSKEQQLAVEDAYIALGSYLEKLAEEANLIFLDEDGKAKALFEVQEVGIIFGSLPNQVFVGSALSST